MKKHYWLLLIFVAGLYLLPVIFRPLMSPDEFRCAEISREMIERGDFITPKLLNARYFENTPMGYWLTAASFKIFGQNAFALRLIPFLGALGSALLLWVWCRKRKYNSETALNAVFLYLAGSMVWVYGTFASLDSLFCLWLTGTMVCFAIAMESRELKERLLWLTGAGIAVGCGFLTEGFPAYILPGLSITAYLLWQRRWKEFLILPWLPLIVSFLVVAPWGMAIHKAEPDFWHYFVIYGQIQRFMTGASSQVAAPFWILAPFLLFGLFPAAFPVLAGSSELRKNGMEEFRRSPEVRLALCCVLLPFIFLSFSAGKHPSWVLPCFAPCAMLGALFLDKTEPERLPASLRRLTTTTAVLFIIIGSLALLAGLFYLLWGTGFIPSLPLKIAVWAPFLTTTALGMIISGTVFVIYRRSKLPEPASYFILFAGVFLISSWFLPGFTGYCKMPEYELLEIASKLSAKNVKRLRIIASPKLMHAAAWCFKDSSLQLYNHYGELEYGHKSAIARGERAIMLKESEIETIISTPHKEGFLILQCKGEDPFFKRHHFGLGEDIMTDGEVRAFYYPPNVITDPPRRRPRYPMK